MNFGFVVAVEQHGDGGFPSIQFAKSDARAFGEAIKNLGFQLPAGVLTDEQATADAVRSSFSSLVRGLTVADTLFVCYVGHGFAKDGRSYLTCYDTQAANIEETSIPLSWLLDQLETSQGGQVALFLDVGERSSSEANNLVDSHGPLRTQELIRFVEPGDNRVVFLSCKPGQRSWPSGQVQHGVWAYHVIEAFKGGEPLALERGRWLTSTSLQNFLRQAVPRTLRLAYSDKKDQLPELLGPRSGALHLADLSQILAEKTPSAPSDFNPTGQVQLLRIEKERVRKLPGFKKTHHVPDVVNEHTTAFVAAITADDLDQDLNRRFDRLREAFSFKRRDLSIANPGSGDGTIITPYFNYSVSVSLNPDDPSEVIWRRQISDIKEAQQVLSDEFEEVFGTSFDMVRMPSPVAIEVADFIDRIEDLDDPRIGITYDKEATSCEITIAGYTGELRIESTAYWMIRPRGEPAKQLLGTFLSMHKALQEIHAVPDA